MAALVEILAGLEGEALFRAPGYSRRAVCEPSQAGAVPVSSRRGY